MTLREFAGGLTRPQRTLAALLLVLAAGLRLWDLGGHSQWYDEILVTVHSSFPLSYILDLSWRVEIHPPFFYLFNKALQAVSPSDAFLRLPAALAGLASLPLIGLIAARFSEKLGPDSRLIGLTAMALACVNPQHIWISRQVRPYAIMQLFCCMAVLALLRLLAEPKRGNVVRLALANLPVLMLHYLGLALLASQGVCLAAMRLFRLSAIRTRDILLFAALGFCASLPALPFLISTKFLHANPFLVVADNAAATQWKLSTTILEFFSFGYFDDPKLGMLPASVIALGLVVLWRHDRLKAVTALLLLVAFPLMLLAAGYSGHFTPVHLSYFLPVAFACQAVAFLTLLPVRSRRAWVVACLAAALCALTLTRNGPAFYSPDKDVVDAWHHQERYAAVARWLAHNAGQDDFPLIDHGFAAQAVEWYMDRQNPPHSLGQFGVRAEQPFVNLLYFSKETDLQKPMATNAFIRDVLVPPSRQGEIGRITLYMLPVARAGRLDWNPGSRLAAVDFRPDRLLGTVRSLTGVRVFPERQFWICPARTGVPGEALFRFQSPEPFQAGDIYVVMDAQMRRPGNRLELEASFDGGEYSRVFALEEPYRQGPIWLRIPAGKPFSVMDLRLRMEASGTWAYLIDGPQEQVRVNGLLAFVPTRDNRFHGNVPDVREEGLEMPEALGTDAMYRWGRQRSSLSFRLDNPATLALHYDVSSPLAGQKGVVSVNGQPAGTIDLSAGPAKGRVAVPGNAGDNLVEIAWEKANAGPDAFAPDDPRPLAVKYRLLALEKAEE